jgi:hypothetical protein
MQAPRCREFATNVEAVERLTVIPKSSPEHDLRHGQNLDALCALIASRATAEERHDG